MRNHRKLVEIAISYFKSQGYIIEDDEVTVGTLPNGSKVRADLVIEKDGKIVPVECGRIRLPFEKSQFYKENFDDYKHFTYGKAKKIIGSSTRTKTARIRKKRLTISLDEEVARKLDEARKETLTPRSTYLNKILRKYFKLDDKVPID